MKKNIELGLIVFILLSIVLYLFNQVFILIVHISAGFLYSFIRDNNHINGKMLNILVNAVPVLYICIVLLNRKPIQFKKEA